MSGQWMKSDDANRFLCMATPALATMKDDKVVTCAGQFCGHACVGVGYENGRSIEEAPNLPTAMREVGRRQKINPEETAEIVLWVRCGLAA